METIKIKRHISSSTLRIKELEKFLNKNVQISITPIKEMGKNFKELLKISQWDIEEDEEDIGLINAIKSGRTKDYIDTDKFLKA